MKVRRAARNAYKCVLREWESLHTRGGRDWRVGVTPERINATFDRLEKSIQKYLRTFPPNFRMLRRGDGKIQVISDYDFERNLDNCQP